MTALGQGAGSSAPLMPQGVNIYGLKSYGIGCPSGPVTDTFSLDNRFLSINFSDYNLDSNDANNITDTVRSKCLIKLNIDVPQGYSMAVSNMNARGKLYIPWGGQSPFFC